MNPHRIFRLFILAAFLLPTISQGAEAAAPPAETKEQRDARMQWWREAKFGMFIHWGVFAVPAGWYQGKPINYFAEWLMHRSKIPMAEYQLYAKQFNPTKYSPEDWVKLAKDSGMKYMVITTKHHDGFAMFKTKASPFNIVDASPYGKDAIQELAAACRKHGMKLGFYYSQAQDWNNGGATDFGNHTPDWDPAQKHDMDEYIDKVAVPQVKELLTNYGEFPAILWWDTPTNMTKERAKRLNDAVHALRPDIITNNRLGGGGSGDTETPEGYVPPQGYPGRDWETCMTLNNSWGYVRGDENWKTTRTIIRNLSDIVSKGGNYLLNMGPTETGIVPQPNVDRFMEVGEWMKVNGAAIYGTTGSPFSNRFTWGRVTQKADASGTGTTLYVHVWDWPKAAGSLVLPNLDQMPDKATVLANGSPVDCRVFQQSLVVRPATAAPDRDVSVLALHFSKPLNLARQLPSEPGADGSIRFSTIDAILTGNGQGDIAIAANQDGIYLTDWTHAGWWPTFRVKTPAEPKTREWDISVEVAGYTTTVDVACGKSILTATIPSTGGRDTWSTVSLGTVTLPGGTSEFSIRPPKSGWNGLDLRRVILIPHQSPTQ